MALTTPVFLPYTVAVVSSTEAMLATVVSLIAQTNRTGDSHPPEACSRPLSPRRSVTKEGDTLGSPTQVDGIIGGVGSMIVLLHDAAPIASRANLHFGFMDTLTVALTS